MSLYESQLRHLVIGYAFMTNKEATASWFQDQKITYAMMSTINLMKSYLFLCSYEPYFSPPKLLTYLRKKKH